MGQKSSKTKRRSRRKEHGALLLWRQSRIAAATAPRSWHEGAEPASERKRPQFATTSLFTDEAVAFAKDNGINLLDVSGLLHLIKSRSSDQQRALLDVALEGEYWRPTCVNCGVKLVVRQPKQGGKPFWGCARYPACRMKMVMSAAVAPLAGVGV